MELCKASGGAEMKKKPIICPTCGNELDMFVSWRHKNRCYYCESSFEASEVGLVERKKKCGSNDSNNDVKHSTKPGCDLRQERG